MKNSEFFDAMRDVSGKYEELWEEYRIWRAPIEKRVRDSGLTKNHSDYAMDAVRGILWKHFDDSMVHFSKHLRISSNLESNIKTMERINKIFKDCDRLFRIEKRAVEVKIDKAISAKMKRDAKKESGSE